LFKSVDDDDAYLDLSQKAKRAKEEREKSCVEKMVESICSCDGELARPVSWQARLEQLRHRPHRDVVVDSDT
jgi:hypothetical protein